MDHRRIERFFAITSPGLLQSCAAELTEIGITTGQLCPGGVEFSGNLGDLYLASLHLRVASRLVVRFANFRCRSFPELYRQSAGLPWGRFVSPETRLSCRVTCRASRLIHSGRVATTVIEAANRALGRRDQPQGTLEQLVLVRIVNDMVELSIDSSGNLLHRRGFRSDVTAAPMRETLAAGILRLLSWTGAEPLADPMCGSGTLLLEGAMLAINRAPGLHREFAFMHWPGYRPGLWQRFCQQAACAERPCLVTISGGDCDAAALRAAQGNLTRAGLEDLVTLHLRPLAGQPVHAGGGLVICNPPYGRRLGASPSPANFFAALGHELERAYPGWRKAILCPEPNLAVATGLPLRKVAELDNGGLQVGLYACAGQ